MAEAWPRIPVTLRWVRLCVCEGSYRVYRWRGAHQSGGANRGGGAGSDPDTRDHQRPGEHLHTHVHTADLKNMCEQCIKRILSPYVSSQNVRHTWWLQLFRHEGLLLFCVYVLAYLISLCFQPLLRKKQSSWRCNLGPFFSDFLAFYTLNCGANYKGNSLQINQWALTAGLHRVFITVTGWMFISCVESAHAAVKRSVKVKSLGENRSRFQDKFSHKPKICPFCLQLVRMDYTEVIIDQRFHRHLIGKNGANSECT